jgi:protein-tyrosine phosphatase
MAMAIMRGLVKDSQEPWRIESAGTWPVEGAQAAVRTQIVVKENGQDLSSHRSRTVNKELLESFNLILTMEQGHKEAINIEFPGLGKRIYLLSEMIGSSYDIPDPIGKSQPAFDDTYRELEQILKLGFERIRKLAS